MKTDTIAVVGSGTAGLVSALILKTAFPEKQIDIICSKRIGIIGVGEGSTEHWETFAAYVGINTAELIKECDATFKIGIVFKDWGVPDYMHSIQDGYSLIANQYPFVYSRVISQGLDSKSMSGKIFWENKIQNWFLNNNQTPVAQYHFNTFKLNEFLTKIAIEKGITIHNDEITSVNLADNGNIDTITSSEFTYVYDFYVDCTGFKKFLISKLGATWVSHSDYLKTNSALVFQTEDTDNYNMWSLSQAMKYGWLFKTPTYGRWGNGYIYDSEFLTPAQAQAEVEEFLGCKITVGQHIKFDPGALDKSWIKNCCAIGLSSSFVEPLEASSIGASIQQSFMLSQRLVNYNESVIDRYNEMFTDIVHNIRDFILLHFICPRRDTEFWRKVASVELPPELDRNLKIWKDKLPIEDDFKGSSRQLLFKAHHFLLVLQGLQWFNNDSILKEFKSLPKNIQEEADIVIKDLEYGNRIDQPDTSTHKEMLTVIRNNT
jgi:tryptophan halogenase